MALYLRTEPVEATQVTGNANTLRAWADQTGLEFWVSNEGNALFFDGLGGTQVTQTGDWIVRIEDGTFRRYDNTTFTQKFRPV